MRILFISHVSQDHATAIALAQALERAGYSTWYYERDCVPGPSYLVQTGDAIANSRAVLVLVSPNSITSHQVTREVVRAHECGKHFLPVLDGISHDEFQRRQREWREAFGAATSVELNRADASATVTRLVEGLKALGIAPGEPACAAEPRTTAAVAARPVGPDRRHVGPWVVGTALVAVMALAAGIAFMAGVWQGPRPDASAAGVGAPAAAGEPAADWTTEESLRALIRLDSIVVEQVPGARHYRLAGTVVNDEEHQLLMGRLSPAKALIGANEVRVDAEEVSRKLVAALREQRAGSVRCTVQGAPGGRARLLVQASVTAACSREGVLAIVRRYAVREESIATEIYGGDNP